MKTIGWPRVKLLALFCAALIPSFTSAQPATVPATTQQSHESLQLQSDLGYLQYLPPGYAEDPANAKQGDGKGWPLVVFLHGSGQRGTDLEVVKQEGLPKLVAEGRQYPFILISPQVNLGERWNAFSLLKLLDHLEQTLHVDKDRIYVTGLSMGGFGIWELAQRANDRLAAIVPICGGGDPNWPQRSTAAPVLPTWAFHGAADDVVSPRLSEQMIDALHAAGNKEAKLTIYPGVGHTSWRNAYDDPELFRWMLAQRRHPALPPPSTQPARVDHARINSLQGLNYLAYVPPQYAADPTHANGGDGKGWPLVLFLHGAGERGEDLNKITTQGLPKLIAQGRDFPFLVISPQCPTDGWWDAGLLFELLDEVQRRYHTDPDRVYVTGLSMGGYATWQMAMQKPERFAAVAPICGGGDPAILFLHPKIKDLPVWAFHGEADPIIPVDRSKALVDALRKAGNTQAKLTTYPGVGHDSWTRAYDDPALYEWLLSHKRGE